VREQVRDDPRRVHPAAEGLDAGHVRRQQPGQLPREVHEAPVVVLRHAGLKAQRSGFQVYLTPWP
jgi:hypothetical protein